MAQTIAAPVHSELLIKKSRFLGCVQPVADRTTAQAIIAGLRAAHPGATHVCWALLAGGQSAAVDDGEPSGTAGRPMLEVLRHQDFDGVLASVVRYYGGIQLGAGGLLRAYTDSIAQALRDARKIPIVKQRELSCALPYALEGLLRREIEAVGASLKSIEHGEQVNCAFRLAESEAPALIARLNEAGQGRVVWLEDGVGF
ncbi:IMPACT family protein [Dechloromonas denitrificans]|uniref:IMPACT family protein n=1 Tax=Dechloromonas denitrificans TaxID=281362 RepID=UPI001CF98CA0|nr:YigZ family protein [Dechloromonas denitrificans]UCV06719.1 YigZ family protein [Dechloromonas denitrificans]